MLGADCGTKAFVAAFTESCRHDFVGSNIRWGWLSGFPGFLLVAQ
jgi:NADP-dependent 3-hydroxy acid dehydrogenase YdfG